MILEAMQAGLSWSTVLAKRENFRRAFDQFSPEKVARYSHKKIALLMEDSGIIRNRLKILATVNNAQAYLVLRDSGQTLDRYFWNCLDGRTLRNAWKTIEEVPPSTPLSEVIAKDLKKKGFRFVRPTTVYSLMQSAGMVNDHLRDCHVWLEIDQMAKNA